MRALYKLNPLSPWFVRNGLATFLLATLTLASAAVAQDEDGERREGQSRLTLQPKEDDDRWSFEVAPYLWLAGLDSKLTIREMESETEADFSDILDALELGAMLHVEANKNRWTIYFDIQYLELGEAGKARGIRFEADLDQLILEGGLMRRFGPRENSLELILGARYTSIDVELESNPDLFGLLDVSRGRDWIEPLVGARYRHEFSDRWFFSLKGDVGGFGVGSDLTWGATGLLGYRLNERTTLGFGYRHLDVDYDHDDVEYDTQTSGPLIGVSYHF